MATRLAFVLSLQIFFSPYIIWAADHAVEHSAAHSHNSYDTVEVLQLINTFRAEHKLHTLLVEAESETTAINHARQLAQRRVLSHRNLNGQRVHHRYRLNGGTGIKAGENLGVGHSIPSIFQAWLKSKTHRENILNTHWASIGAGIIPLDNKRKIIVVVFTTSKWTPLKTIRNNATTTLFGLVNVQDFNKSRSLAMRFNNVDYKPIRVSRASHYSDDYVLVEFQLRHSDIKSGNSSAQLVFVNQSSYLITDLILLPHPKP